MTKFVAEVRVEIEIDDADLPEGEDAQFEMAHEAVDVLMQRAWDTDRGRHHINRNWHFTMLEDSITIEDSVDASDPEAWGVKQVWTPPDWKNDPSVDPVVRSSGPIAG